MPSKKWNILFLLGTLLFPIIIPVIYTLKYPLPPKNSLKEYESIAVAVTNIV